MAKAKNVFIKSKMNKDLDDRLVPPGEYRDAQNAQISRSEGADVGALENVLGNEFLSRFNVPKKCNIEVIGRHMDVTNDRIFVFVTNYTDNSSNKLSNRYVYSATSSNSYYSAICMYDIKNSSSVVLVGGSGDAGGFLNFSKTHQINHTNIVEDLLFWTDNRNQPRKINISSAIANPASSSSPYYTKEDNISVAKYYPYKAIRLITDLNESTMENVVDESLPNGDPNPNHEPGWKGDQNFIKDKFLRFSYRFKFEDGEYSLMAPFTQSTFIPNQDGYFIGEFENPTTVGRDDEDNTFQSTEVKFFENKVNKVSLLIESPDNVPFNDLYEELKIDGIDILYRESDGLSVKVVETLPREVFEFVTPASNGVYNTSTILEYEYDSTAPYKTLPEEDTIRVFDKTPIRAAAQEVSGNRVIYGNFINKHTPPRNIDYNVIVDEKGDPSTYLPQFDINNIVEYPNHTLKQNRTYQVGIVLSDRYGRQSSVLLSSVDSGQSKVSILYSGSTVFHEYSTSDDFIIDPSDPGYSWPGDALRVLFNDVLVTGDTYDYNSGEPGVYNELTNPLGWYSYKIVVKQQEQDYYNIYFPGILNGGSEDGDFAIEDPATANNPFAHITLQGDNINKVPRDLKNVGPDQKIFRTSRPTKVENPLWYSVVNAQGEATEATFSDWNSQEARNFILQRNVEFGLTEPDVGENASLKMFLRVDNKGTEHGWGENAQHYTGSYPDTVVNIGTGIDLGLWSSGDIPEYIFNSQANPLIARIETDDFAVGVSANTKLPILSVYETAPEISKLRLFWETTTTGEIAELNQAILDAEDFVVDSEDPTGGSWQSRWKYFNERVCAYPAFSNQYSSDPIACSISSIFHFQNNQGNIIGQTSGCLISLHDVHVENSIGTWSHVTGFALEMVATAGIEYKAFIYITDPLYFSKDSYKNKYKFTLLVTEAGSTTGVELISQMQNAAPFAGWQPDPDINIDNEAFPYLDPELVYPGTEEYRPSPNSWRNFPKDWVDSGYPTTVTGINVSPVMNQDILDTQLENYIDDNIKWLKLPVCNGSWVDGTDSSNLPDWLSDNWERIGEEMNVEVVSQTLLRQDNTGDFVEYNSVDGNIIDHFEVTAPNNAYANLEANFLNIDAGSYIDGDVFKVTVRFTDCWDENANPPPSTPSIQNLQTL